MSAVTCERKKIVFSGGGSEHGCDDDDDGHGSHGGDDGDGHDGRDGRDGIHGSHRDDDFWHEYYDVHGDGVYNEVWRGKVP
mmetsp:Transcript_22254/g.29653  ORF Transcript_22254/g.29653 Transcript_22254/m.29653 type:complete len:81 (-) Transcript_22254:33-275(-)